LGGIKGDEIIQIGMTYQRNGEYIMNTIVTLDTCDPIENAVVIACETEEDVIKKWIEILYYTDPDIILG